MLHQTGTDEQSTGHCQYTGNSVKISLQCLSQVTVKAANVYLQLFSNMKHIIDHYVFPEKRNLQYLSPDQPPAAQGQHCSETKHICTLVCC